MNRISIRARWITAVVAVVVVGAGGVAIAQAAAPDAAQVSEGAAPSTSVDTGSAGGLQDPQAPAAQVTRTDATATRVEIPAIEVDSGLEQLPIDASTGELTPPVEWLSAGWYKDGTVPGDIGPAVIAGHVDSVTAPAVFARLGELTAGDEIRVTLSNGEIETFTVDSMQTAPKDAFPTDVVYGPTPTAQLRLITCDGAFNGATGHYLDNLIVFASLTSS